MNIKVCIGSSCHLKGSRDVVEALKDLINKHRLQNVELTGTFCLDNCLNGVCVHVDGKHFTVKSETVEEFFTKNILKENML